MVLFISSLMNMKARIRERFANVPGAQQPRSQAWCWVNGAWLLNYFYPLHHILQRSPKLKELSFMLKMLLTLRYIPIPIGIGFFVPSH